jgi:hypothetical protein
VPTRSESGSSPAPYNRPRRRLTGCTCRPRQGRVHPTTVDRYRPTRPIRASRLGQHERLDGHDAALWRTFQTGGVDFRAAGCWDRAEAVSFHVSLGMGPPHRAGMRACSTAAGRTCSRLRGMTCCSLVCVAAATLHDSGLRVADQPPPPRDHERRGLRPHQDIREPTFSSHWQRASIISVYSYNNCTCISRASDASAALTSVTQRGDCLMIR